MLNPEYLMLSAQLENGLKVGPSAPTKIPAYFRWHLGDRSLDVQVAYGLYRVNKFAKAGFFSLPEKIRTYSGVLAERSLALELSIEAIGIKFLKEMATSVGRYYWLVPED